MIPLRLHRSSTPQKVVSYRFFTSYITSFLQISTGSAEMSTAQTLRSHSKRSSSAVVHDGKSAENRKKKDEDFVAKYTTDAGQKKKVSGKDNNAQERGKYY